jgi:ABC-2 type transport system permease protein
LYLTPFPYQLYFPVSLYMGKTAGADAVRGLAMQCFWVAATYLLARFAWRRGIRTYAAAGG